MTPQITSDSTPTSSPAPAPRTPKYRLHKATGQAFVEIAGKRYYLGRFDLADTRQKYHRLIAEWEAARRHLPTATPALTVVEMVALFVRHAKAYYRLPDGRQTTEFDNYRQALRPLLALYGSEEANRIGPRALKAVRHQMVAAGWARTNINKQISRVKSVFRWAVEEELIDPGVFHGLLAIRGLRRGRSEARETEPVRPVPEAFINAVEPLVSRQVWAMIQIQLLTGCRPGEVVRLCAQDLDTSGDVWVATLDHHKTSHHGIAKNIFFGPQARRVLEPFLAGRPIHQPLFSPAEADLERRAAGYAARKTPLSCGNAPGTNRKARPRRQPRDRYSTESFCRAIARACDQAFPPPAHLSRQRVAAEGRKQKSLRWETNTQWRKRLGDSAWDELSRWLRDHRGHPHQLRHNAATRYRREFGLELAQTILGHRIGSAITEIYAEANVNKAKDVVGRAG